MGSLVRAEIEATELRRELGIDDRYFDLLELVESAGIRIVYSKIPGGSEGLSVSLNGQDVIFIDPDSGPESRRRFTLAHEFGHQILGHSSACSSESIHGRPSDPHEEEANRFATSLLMPAKLFRNDIKRVHPRFEEISPVAAEYRVSLTSATIRYTEKTKDYCALLCFRPPKPPWFVKSRRAEPWRFRLEPPPGSLISDHFSQINNGAVSETSARAWIENFDRRTAWPLREEVRKVADNTWLVLLSELPDPEDDPDRIERNLDEERERRRLQFRRY